MPANEYVGVPVLTYRLYPCTGLSVELVTVIYVHSWVGSAQLCRKLPVNMPEFVVALGADI